jgi:cyclic pyranopterin phosphate synthase
MSERVIPLIDQRLGTWAALVPTLPIVPDGHLMDGLQRPLRDLRISVTDRCNFRCSYCMPKEVFNKDYPYLPHSALLSFEEITRLTRQFLAHGVRKVRLTGGEPLLRKHLEILVEQLAKLHSMILQHLSMLLAPE